MLLTLPCSPLLRAHSHAAHQWYTLTCLVLHSCREGPDASVSFCTLLSAMWVQHLQTLRHAVAPARRGLDPLKAHGHREPPGYAQTLGPSERDSQCDLTAADKAKGHVLGHVIGMTAPFTSVAFPTSVSSEIAGAPVSEISGPFSTEDIASNCVPALPLNEPILWIVSYTLMSVCGVILLVLITLLLLPVRCRHHPRDPEVVNDESSLVRHRWK